MPILRHRALNNWLAYCVRTSFFGVYLERTGALTRQLSCWDSRPGIVELVVTLTRRPFVQKTYQSLFLR